jgi:curved DNA-binding protein CbpA
MMQSKRTGILSIEWPAAGRDPYRKEIVFQLGEPLAAVSNRPQETLTAFLVQTNRLTGAQAAELHEIAKADKRMLPEILMAKQWVAASDVASLLVDHFSFRIFCCLSLSRGQISFKSLLKIPEKILEREPVRLTSSFQQIFWNEARKYLDEDYCRSRFSKRSGHGVRVQGECPLPLPTSDLREWNQMAKAEFSPVGLSFGSLQLLVLALEFGQVHFGESATQKLKNEIYVLLQKAKKSSPFELLSVTEEAPLDVIKKSHLQLIKKYHPDRLPLDADKDLRLQAESFMAVINEAFDILSDAQKRENLIAERELEKVGGRAGIEQRLQAELKYDEVVQSLRRKHYKLALDSLSALEEMLKDNVSFMADLNFAKFMVEKEEKRFDPKNLPKFIKAMDEAMQREASNYWPLFYKATAFRLVGESDRAIQAYEELLDKNPRMSEAASELRFLVMKRDKEKKDPKSKGSSWFKKS